MLQIRDWFKKLGMSDNAHRLASRKTARAVLRRRLQTAFVTLCLNVGFSVAQRGDPAAVRKLIAKLQPVKTDNPLIRLGANWDGGYLVPDDLEGIEACFSPGVDDRATFEEALIQRGIPCFLADASVTTAPIDGPAVSFVRKFLGATNNSTTITLDAWVDQNCPTGDLLLQMDIEGAERIVLLNASEKVLCRFRIIVAEFHHLERLMDRRAFPEMEAAFDRLLHNFNIVHVHPNNWGGTVRCGSLAIPRSLEITFLRKDRADAVGFVGGLPHPLDVKNNPDIADIKLSKEWFPTPRN